MPHAAYYHHKCYDTLDSLAQKAQRQNRLYRHNEAYQAFELVQPGKSVIVCTPEATDVYSSSSSKGGKICRAGSVLFFILLFVLAMLFLLLYWEFA
uniref:Uncharacterized protein n=1 Tax=Trichogramma kaykai TaxID=54128 RepID=A0ABD2XAX7_9HYME